MSAPGLTAALVGGVLTLFSPCSVMLLPAFFSYAFTDAARLVTRTGVFYLGLLVTLVPLGAAAGAAGALLVSHRHILVTVAATLLIILGIVQVLGLPMPSLRPRSGPGAGSGAVSAGTGVGAVFLMGAAFGLAGTCSGPVLGSVLAIAALGGSALHGAMALAVYGAGMTLPLLVLAWGWSRWGRVRALVRPRPVKVLGSPTTSTQVVGGVLSLLVGVFLMVTGGVNEAGVLTALQQFEVESWVLVHLGAVPDWAFVLVLAVVVAVVALVPLHRSRGRRSKEAGPQVGAICEPSGDPDPR